MKENGKATSALKKKLTTVEKEIATELALSGDDEEKLYFDDLGITRLFVDEAHNFKNVPFDTATTMTLGINAAGSARSKDMLDKVRVVQKRNGGKGVVFATGTPITNSITDAFIMQKYLQNGELAMLDLQNFDSWIGMFAEKVTEFEIDVDTNAYRLATRFASFHNLPELTSLLSSIADFHAVDEQAGLPYFSGYHDAVVGKTPAFGAYLKMISDRADSVRSGLVDRKDDNMLKITTDGRKAALDLRLVSPTAAFNINSKVARCAENVAEIYFRTSVNRSTQLVFCDTSTPKEGFNLYDELKRLLVEKGVPEREIAYVHDAVSERQREILFEKVRKGVIRVLLGSTFKLGLGVNIQNRLIALHHLDVPWRPADMTQREGRILRQGNENARVFIFRYIAEESFDAYSWQLLETKQRFISGLLSGSMTERSGSDVADVVLAYAEVKALAIGNPLIKERVEAANELSRFMTLQRKLVEQRERLEKERAEIPVKIKNQRELIEKCEEDRAYYEEWTQTNPPVEDKAWKEIEAEKRKELRARIGAAVRANVLEPSEKRAESYRGFEIVLPANMLPTRPYLYLERKGRYVVDLGETDAGILIRIDHCLESLGDRAKELTAILERLKVRAGEIESELSKEEGFAEIIEEYKNKVEQLDKKLGVKEK